MTTIAEENKKILRKALDVIAGMDAPFYETGSVTNIAGNYPGGSEAINKDFDNSVLMDLSGGGFLNDGFAQPLGANIPGILNDIGEDLTFTVNYTDNTGDYPETPITIVGYYNGNITKVNTEAQTADQGHVAVSIDAETWPERFRVLRVIVGESWWFDNSSLISCDLQLRAVETKVEAPELQMSELEIKGYEPNDITDMIGYIGTELPMYYTSGYSGDMAPMRKFYLGEPIEWEDRQITIKGYDATMFLDEDFEGAYVTGGVDGYASWLSTLLTNSGVTHEYTNDGSSEGVSNSGRFIPNNQSKRNVIADAVNLYRFGPFEDPGEAGYVAYVNYVDAGIPKLKLGKDTQVTVIENTTRPKASVEPAIKRVEMNNYVIDINSSTTIETVSVSGIKFGETTDPYYSFSASGGTITMLGPYNYKLKGNGNITVSGRAFDFMSPTPMNPEFYLPLWLSTDKNGITVTLEDFYGGVGDIGINSLYAMFQALLDRSNITYEFDFRGDPKLQPRDYIRVDIDGSGTLVDMTIDTIELRHEGGGTSSTIVARKGFI